MFLRGFVKVGEQCGGGGVVCYSTYLLLLYQCHWYLLSFCSCPYRNVLNPRNNLFSLSVFLPLCDKASSGTDSDSGSEGVPELEEQQDMGTSQMHSQVNFKNSEI